MKPTVFVVDDEPAVQQSLQWLLESVGLPVQTFSSASEFLGYWRSEMPGCLLLDLRMPGISGVELMEQLRQLGSIMPIIVVTAHGDVPVAVHAMKAGAMEFIEKPYSDQLLLDRVQAAMELDAQRRRELASRTAMADRVSSLTPRERQVMEMVVAGQSNRQIAAGLSLSEKTVEVHRAHVMEKMRAGSLAQLVRMVLVAQGKAETSLVESESRSGGAS
ncbi:MAG: response regulator transcription factor [Phycisphaeraceae bacterium]|nr:response regulator transcription factor [Phycisphaeraceae bacterium]